MNIKKLLKNADIADNDVFIYEIQGKMNMAAFCQLIYFL